MVGSARNVKPARIVESVGMRTDIFSVMFVMEPIIHTASGIYKKLLKKLKKNIAFYIIYEKKLGINFE